LTPPSASLPTPLLCPTVVPTSVDIGYVQSDPRCPAVAYGVVVLSENAGRENDRPNYVGREIAGHKTARHRNIIGAIAGICSYFILNFTTNRQQ